MTSTDLDSFLTAVTLRCEAEISNAEVAQPAQALLRVGGKQLRARILWWSATATAHRHVRPDDAALVQAAAAIELAHLGSLLHDDIVDGAEHRRGVLSVHRERGARLATDAGASLAHLASTLFAPLGTATRRAVRRATLALCRGQIRELTRAFVVISPRERLAIMQEKTAALFELTAGVGASLVGADPPQRTAIKRYARRFGVAFQIADDILDLTGDAAELGRSNGADLREGVMTLPVLFAAARDRGIVPALARLQRSPTPHAVAACAARVARSDGITDAAAVAQWWLARGIAALDVLAPGQARDALAELARSSVGRGLRPGRTDYSASASAIPPAIFNEPPEDGANDAKLPLVRDLGRSLDWIFPGLSIVVRAVGACDDAIRAHVESVLLRGQRWSKQAETAAAAIALAHAVTTDDALHRDPVRAIAVADCLHCLGIANLCVTYDEEHERLALRAQALSPHTARDTTPRPASSRTDAATSVAMIG